MMTLRMILMALALFFVLGNVPGQPFTIGSEAYAQRSEDRRDRADREERQDREARAERRERRDRADRSERRDRVDQSRRRPDISRQTPAARGEFRRRPDRPHDQDRDRPRDQDHDRDRDRDRDHDWDRDRHHDRYRDRHPDRDHRWPSWRHHNWHPLGFIIAALATDCDRINWEGQRYYYCDGVFYKRHGSRYVVVYPPIGLRLHYRPYSCHVVRNYDDEYCYHYGVYYHWDRDLQFYVVVRPPSGLAVTYLPLGYEEFRYRGLRHYRYGGVHYRPHYRDGIVIYITIRLDD